MDGSDNPESMGTPDESDGSDETMGDESGEVLVH